MWLTGPNLGAANFDNTITMGPSLPSLPKYPLTLALASTRPATSNTFPVTLGGSAGYPYTGIRNDVGAEVDAYLNDAAGTFVSSRVGMDAISFHTVVEVTRPTFYTDGVIVGTPVAITTPPTGRLTYHADGGGGVADVRRRPGFPGLVRGRGRRLRRGPNLDGRRGPQGPGPGAAGAGPGPAPTPPMGRPAVVAAAAADPLRRGGGPWQIGRPGAMLEF